MEVQLPLLTRMEGKVSRDGTYVMLSLEATSGVSLSVALKGEELGNIVKLINDLAEKSTARKENPAPPRK